MALLITDTDHTPLPPHPEKTPQRGWREQPKASRSPSFCPNNLTQPPLCKAPLCRNARAAVDAAYPARRSVGRAPSPQRRGGWCRSHNTARPPPSARPGEERKGLHLLLWQERTERKNLLFAFSAALTRCQTSDIKTCRCFIDQENK